MEYPLIFARHFAHLVWLLVNEGSEYDAQIATLRALVQASRAGGVVFTVCDWSLTLNGDALPEDLPFGQDLAMQLAGHCVTELAVQTSASPSDLLGCARILASDPVPGGDERAVKARLHALDIRTIRMMITPPTLATSVPASVPATDSGIVRELQAPDETMPVVMVGQTPKETMDLLFQHLDAMPGTSHAGNVLGALVKLGLDAARKERGDLVADIFAGLTEREARATQGEPMHRSLRIAIRRVCTPTMLGCMAGILPQRKEHYERYLAAFARAGDAGAEALADALVAAPSIRYRRLYFDTLVRLGAGVQTLTHMLGDPRWFVARNAAEILGEMGVTQAVPELTRLLDHPDDRVRAAAGGALAKLSSPTAERGVRTALRDITAEVREHVVDAAVGRGGPGSVRSLARALDQEGDDAAQRAMLTALARLGTPAAVAKLVAIASSERGIFKRTPVPLRVAAVHALAEVDSPSARQALRALLHDDQKEVRGAASWVVMGMQRRNEE
jgi:HEAT repeat protein